MNPRVSERISTPRFAFPFDLYQSRYERASSAKMKIITPGRANDLSHALLCQACSRPKISPPGRASAPESKRFSRESNMALRAATRDENNGFPEEARNRSGTDLLVCLSGACGPRKAMKNWAVGPCLFSVAWTGFSTLSGRRPARRPVPPGSSHFQGSGGRCDGAHPAEGPAGCWDHRFVRSRPMLRRSFASGRMKLKVAPRSASESTQIRPP